jgi:hypothetical protein
MLQKALSSTVAPPAAAAASVKSTATTPSCFHKENIPFCPSRSSLSMGSAFSPYTTPNASHTHRRVLPRVSLCPSSDDVDGTTTVKAVRGTRLEKEHFMEFTKILIKYLETMNPSLCHSVRRVLVQVADHHQRQDPGYNDLSVQFLQQQLRQVVGDAYWTRVETYHNRYRQVQKAHHKRAACVRLAKESLAALKKK